MRASTPAVHIVDDDEHFRNAMERLLQAAGYDVLGYNSVSTFLSRDPVEARGCVLADLKMPGQSGLDLQRELITSGNPIPIIFLSAYGDIPTSVSAMRDGALDFLVKPVRKDPLFDAVERGMTLDYEAREKERQRAKLRVRLESMTSREREVLSHVIAGKLNKQIAFELGISERTVKAHRASLVSKLQARSVAELVRLAEVLDFEPAL